MPQLCRTSFATKPLLASAIKRPSRETEGQRKADGTTSSGSLTFPVSNAIFPGVTAAHNFLSLLALPDQALQSPSAFSLPRF